MNIYQKLVEVRKEVPYLQKENKGYQFNYVSSSQVLASIKRKMDELGLLLIPNIDSSKVTMDIFDKTDAKGNTKRTVDYFTEIEINFTWVNAENPEEKITCHWYGQGLDTAGEKGVGKALTYAEKYFMLKFFNIPTDKDDPDSFQEKIEKSDTINETLQKKIWSIAGKTNAKLVKEIIGKHGYINTSDIKTADYDKIVKEIEASVNKPN